MGGMFAKLFSRSRGRDTRVLMLGLDSAGKTTILCIFLSLCKSYTLAHSQFQNLYFIP